MIVYNTNTRALLGGVETHPATAEIRMIQGRMQSWWFLDTSFPSVSHILSRRTLYRTASPSMTQQPSDNPSFVVNSKRTYRKLQRNETKKIRENNFTRFIIDQIVRIHFLPLPNLINSSNHHASSPNKILPNFFLGQR